MIETLRLNLMFNMRLKRYHVEVLDKRGALNAAFKETIWHDGDLPYALERIDLA